MAQLYSDLSKDFLQNVLREEGAVADWSSASRNFRIFRQFFADAGLDVVMQNWDFICPVLRTNMHQQKSVKVRANVFRLLTDATQESHEVW